MTICQKKEFLEITQDILKHPRFLETKNTVHHGPGNSLYEHSVSTAYFAFRVAKWFRFSKEDTISTTRAALLHDFFGYDWRDGDKPGSHVHGVRKIWQMHAFQHGYRAANHASKYFLLTDRQRDAIAKHMFPLIPFFPKYKESWVTTCSDKVVACREMTLCVADVCQRGVGKVVHAFA